MFTFINKKKNGIYIDNVLINEKNDIIGSHHKICMVGFFFFIVFPNFQDPKNNICCFNNYKESKCY